MVSQTNGLLNPQPAERPANGTPTAPPSASRKSVKADAPAGPEFAHGLRLFEKRPNHGGQFVYRKAWACGCITVECIQGRDRYEADLQHGQANDCYRCQREKRQASRPLWEEAEAGKAAAR